MSKKNVYILMFKDYEVLSFKVDLRKCRATFIEKLDHFDKAPYGFDDDNTNLDFKLMRFFNSRSIPFNRVGYKEIMKATHSKNGFHLSFKGHGLSLSNHYWYKKKGENLRYEDINFFTNKWDDSFGRALINENYKALEKASFNVPDIVMEGWGKKGWIYDEEKGPKLIKLGLDKDHYEEALGEVLASRLAQRLLGKGDALEYELVKVNDKYASSCSPMIGIDEELISFSDVLSLELNNLYRNFRFDKNVRQLFFEKLVEAGYQEFCSFFVKLSCLRTLCFVNDLHFGNASVIRDLNTGEIRTAPIYDLGGSFGSSRTAKSQLENPNKATMLLIYFMYSNLDPNWDYSWYDKNSLNGFEDEIREILSKSNFYTPDILDFIIAIFKQQKAALEEYACKEC